MSHPDKKIERLKNLLRTAYREKERLGVGDRWPEQAMRRIRNLAAEETPPSFAQAFGNLIWRLAPAAGAFIIILSVVLINSDTPSTYDLYQLLTYEFESSSFSELISL